MANKVILDVNKDILKMLEFDTSSDAVTLKIAGKNPANYRVTPVEMIDQNLRTCHPDHRDALLDTRNYLYKKDGADVIDPT